MPDLPVSCTLSTPQIQERRAQVLHQIRARVKEHRVLPDGCALRFEADDACLESILRLIQLERKCCSFLHFQLTVEPGQRGVWLELTGPEGTTEFIAAEMELLP